MIRYDDNGHERLPVHLPGAGDARHVPRFGYWPTLCGRWAPTAHMPGFAHEDCPPCLGCDHKAKERGEA